MKRCIEIAKNNIINMIHKSVYELDDIAQFKFYEEMNSEYNKLPYHELKFIKSTFKLFDRNKILYTILRHTEPVVVLPQINKDSHILHIIANRLVIQYYKTHQIEYMNQAKDILKKSMNLKNHDSQTTLGILEYLDENYANALNYWIRAVASGNIRAMYCMADYYKNDMMKKEFEEVSLFYMMHNESDGIKITNCMNKYKIVLDCLLAQIEKHVEKDSGIYKKFYNRILCDMGDAYVKCDKYCLALHKYILAINNDSEYALIKYYLLFIEMDDIDILLILLKMENKSKFVENEIKKIFTTSKSIKTIIKKQILNNKMNICECTICYEMKPTIMTQCKHIFCIDCYLRGCIDRCAMCRRE